MHGAGGSGSYEEVCANIEKMKKAGGLRGRPLSDQDLALAMRSIVRTEEVPPGILRKGQARNLYSFTYLMFGREAVREQSMVSWSPMMLDLIGNNKLNWQEALYSVDPATAQPSRRYKGGTNPVSFEGGSTSARGVRQVETTHVPTNLPATKAQRREYANREKELAWRWFDTVTAEMVAKGEVFKTEADCVQFIRQKLFAHYGLTP